MLLGTAVVPGEGIPVTAGLSEGDSKLSGIAELAGAGTVVGIAGIEFSGGFVVTAGEIETVGEGIAESVGKGVFVGTGFPEGSIVADGDADSCTSFFKSSMICCSEFFRFRRGVV